MARQSLVVGLGLLGPGLLLLPLMALENRLNSCGAQNPVAPSSMWDLPGPGISVCHLHWQADSAPFPFTRKTLLFS